MVQVAVSLILMTSIADSVREFHREDLQKELLSDATVLAATIQDSTNPPRLPDSVARAATTEGLRLTLIASDGRVLQDNQSPAADMDNHAGRPEIAEALRSGSGKSIRFSQTVGADLVYAAIAMPRPNGGSVILRVSQPLSLVTATERRITTAIGIALSAAVLITLLTLILLSRSISSRTRRAASAAKRFASGDFTGRLQEDGPIEMSGLARSLNGMAEELDSSISALQVQTSEMLAILQSMSNAVIALDREHRIIRLNNASLQMFDLADIDLRGRLLQEVIREPALQEAADTALKSRIRFTAEISFSQSTRIAELVAEPMTDGRGETIGTVVVLEEVTRLRQLERIRTDFAANVSHELRTPITSIGGYAEILQDTDDPVMIRKCADVIVRNTHRLSAIIEDLLALARIEDPQRRSMLDLEPVRISSVIDSVIHLTKESAGAQNVSLISRIDGDPVARGTRPLLEQAISNLVSNAIKYGGGEAPIEIRCSTTDQGMVQIDVEDFGPGIAHEHLDRIFERFYRVDRSRSRELGGTGLGLAIVKHIAGVLGGSIEARSQLGVGSIFTITLPSG